MQSFLKLLKLSLVLPALLCVIAIRLLAKAGVLIRFGQFWSERIGHLTGNTEVYLCEKDAGLHPGFHIWVHRGKISNKQIAKMYGRVMTVGPIWFTGLVILINMWFRGFQKHLVGATQVDRDIHNLLEKTPCHISFTKKEEEMGRAQMREWGIPDGAKWVCLIVRDGAYLPELGYHSYRDTHIDAYELAVKELVNMGYYVFRMGAKVAKPFKLGGIGGHRHVFDYATNGMRSDFMDVYLGAKCEFCISTGTGFDGIPFLFRRPICYVNYVPVEYFQTYVFNGLVIWKHHYKDGKRMSFKEIVESGAGQFMRAEQFEKAGITLQDDSPEEIRDVVLEMAQGMSTEPQDWFWKDFPRSISPYNQKPLQGEIRVRAGAKFLEQYL